MLPCVKERRFRYYCLQKRCQSDISVRKERKIRLTVSRQRNQHTFGVHLVQTHAAQPKGKCNLMLLCASLLYDNNTDLTVDYKNMILIIPNSAAKQMFIIVIFLCSENNIFSCFTFYTNQAYINCGTVVLAIRGQAHVARPKG